MKNESSAANFFGNGSIISGLIDHFKKNPPPIVINETKGETPAETEESVSDREETAVDDIFAEETFPDDCFVEEGSAYEEPVELSLDWDSVCTDPRTEGIHTDSIPDALVMSLTRIGCVDLEYISSVTGQDFKTIVSVLKGSIYQNPDTWENCFYKGWETADEYLSGNVVRKWRSAILANNIHAGYFADNVDVLERILPPTVTAENIYVAPGSPLVTPEMVDAFIAHILRLGNGFSGTKHDEITGTWEIPDKSAFKYNVRSNTTYGTDRMSALHILEKLLNMKTVVVYKEGAYAYSDNNPRIIDREATLHALERQDKLVAEFRDWVWKDPERRRIIEMKFENNFGCRRSRTYDGSFLDFPNMSQSVTLLPYQKNAVARILFSPNTLLAHDVGSGKTYVMIAAGMELKRMGLSRKNMFVVPNNIVGQWRDIFLELYPDANILCVESKNFTPAKRQAVLERMRDEDFDGIIISYSCFEQIPMSYDALIDAMHEEIVRIDEVMKDNKKKTSSLQKRRDSISDKITKLVQESIETDGGAKPVCFDSLGVTRLFVDEAHNFKNVPIDTKITKVLGISATGSKKCRDMMDKVQFTQRMNDGGGVVLATGTPITNSVTDVYIMQRFLQSGELMLLDIHNFDAWIGMFAERCTEFEIDVDTSSYRLATRFSKFHNLPELTTLLSSVADFHRVDSAVGIPEFDGYTDVLVSKTAPFEDYLKDISRRAEDCRSGKVKRTEDNLLKITTDGRQAALDIRLVRDDVGFTFESKVAKCAERVFRIYSSTMQDRLAQLVFCDTSTPKEKFNIYDELKRLLVDWGVRESDIAYIHDATTEKKREQLFEKVRLGEIRILVGSTFKLGLGVNVQDRLVAVHHLDVPWRPGDMVQREGRILRQGNINEKVQIFRYITEGSFDAYSWQLLETKQRFISDLLAGTVTDRDADDIESTVLNYAEVKALAVGNPLVKKRVEAANTFNRLLALQRKTVDTRLSLERDLAEIPGQMEHQESLIAKCKDDLIFYRTNYREYEKDDRRVLGERLLAALAENVLAETETVFGEYQGFEIRIPANMIEERPFIWLQKNGRYYLEMGSSDKGNVVRIDNFLNGLADHLKKLTDGRDHLVNRKASIEAELARGENYTEQIEEYRRIIADIDKELGVAV